VHGGQLDHDLVLALLRDDGLGDAELVDAVAHDVDRPRHVVRRQDVPARRLRLQDDLEAALQIESLPELLVDRGARPADKEDADERCHEQRHERQV